MTDNVWPEDTATGAPNKDWSDAAHIAQHGFNETWSDVVLTGLSFTVDFGVPDFDLSSGSCRISDTSAQTQDHSGVSPAQSQRTLDQVVYAGQLDSRTGVSLTDSAVNHIFIQFDLTSNDTINVVTNTTGSSPSDPAFKIGEIDTANDTSRETNRGPRHTESVSLTGGIPTTITHSIGEKFVNVQFYDNNDQQAELNRIELLNDDKIEIESSVDVNGQIVVTNP